MEHYFENTAMTAAEISMTPLQSMIEDSGREWSIRQRIKLDELLRGARAKHREQLLAERKAVELAQRSAFEWRHRYEEATERLALNDTKWRQHLGQIVTESNQIATKAFSREMHALSQKLTNILPPLPLKRDTTLTNIFSRFENMNKTSLQNANQFLSQKVERAVTKVFEKSDRSLLQYVSAVQTHILLRCAAYTEREQKRNEDLLRKMDTAWRHRTSELVQHEYLQRRADTAFAAAAEAKLFSRPYTERAVHNLLRVRDAVHYSSAGSEAGRAGIACLQRELGVREAKSSRDLQEERDHRERLLESLGTQHAQEILRLETEHQVELEQLRLEHAEHCRHLEEFVRSKTLDEIKPAVKEQVRAALAANDAAHDWHRPVPENKEELTRLQQELDQARRLNSVLHNKLAEARRCDAQLLSAAKDAYLADRTVSLGKHIMHSEKYSPPADFNDDDDDFRIATRRRIDYSSRERRKSVPLVSYLATNLDRTRRRSPALLTKNHHHGQSSPTNQ